MIFREMPKQQRGTPRRGPQNGALETATTKRVTAPHSSFLLKQKMSDGTIMFLRKQWNGGGFPEIQEVVRSLTHDSLFIPPSFFISLKVFEVSGKKNE